MAAAPTDMPFIGGIPCCCGGLFFGIAGAGILADAYKQYKTADRIRNTPTSKARSAAVGLVELAGKARCQETLISPITKSKCAYYEVVAQYYYQHKKRSGWRTFHHESSAKRFYIEDDTGRVLIEPKGASVQIPSDFSFQGHLDDKFFFGLLPQTQVDPKVLAYLNENPAAKEAAKAQGGKNLRFLEYYIAEGDPLFVLGSAEPLEGASSAVASENLVVRLNSRDRLMMISDSSEKKVLGGLALRFWIEIGFGLFMLLGFLGGIGMALMTMAM